MTRKFTFLMTAMALILAIMGPRNVAWGQTTTYTMQSYSNNIITSDNDATWATSSACGGSELPYALNSKRGAGFQANNTVTSSISVTNASKITVIASSNGNNTTTLAVKVGNTTFGNTVSVPQQNYQTLEFTAPNNTPVSGTIVFTITRTSKTLWIGQVIVETATPSTDPSITVNPTTITWNDSPINVGLTDTISVSQANLTEGITISSTIGTVTPSTIAAGEDATDVTFTYTPTSVGDFEGTITFTSGETTATVSVTGSAYDPSQVDTYELFTGDLVEGDYVIYYDGKAMKNTVTSNRLDYSEVSPVNNAIANPDAAIVWHIAQSGDYWTIYSEAINKYAAGTTSKNQATLIESITDYAKWTVSTSNGKYEFVNLGRANSTSDPGNKYLRNNGTNGWACYASATGGALTLYKKAENKAATPTLTESQIFTTKPFEVTITNNEAGATVYYTTDGNDPTTETTTYFTGDSKTIEINTTTTVKAMAVVEGKANSEIASATYTEEKTNPNNLWSVETYTATIGGENTFPIFTTQSDGAVTYTSSNTNAATIDNTGVITLVAAGTTTITASTAETDTYMAGNASYTLTVKEAPLTTMDAIFAKATAVGSTATNVEITFSNWVISGVKGSNAYLTDNAGKGLIIYTSDHGFAVGDVLNGTIACQIKLYSGASELMGVTSETSGLTVTKNGEITIHEVSIADLSGVNTGAVIKVNNVQYNGTNLVDENSNIIKPYNAVDYNPTFTNGLKYNVTGVYIQFNTTKEIAPRSADDIEEIVPTEPSITVAEMLNLPYNESEVETLEVSYENVDFNNIELTLYDVTGATFTGDWFIADFDEDFNIEYYALANTSSSERKVDIEIYAFGTDGVNDITRVIHVTQAAAPAPHNVTLSSNGVVGEPQPVQGSITLSDPTNIPTGFTFAGWTESESNIQIVDNPYTPTSNVTLYAVFSREEGAIAGSGNYEKVTSALTDWSGEYLIVYEDENEGITTAKVFNGKDEGHDYITATITNNVIASDDGEDGTDSKTVEIASMEGGYSIMIKSGDNAGKYISGTSNSNKLNFNASAQPNSISFEDEGGVKIVSNTSILMFNTASGDNNDRFRYYKPTNTYPYAQLYKKSTGTPGTTHYYTRVYDENTTLGSLEVTGPSIILSDYTLTVTGSMTNTNAANLIIEDGAQLFQNSSNVMATFQKNITGYTGDNDNYYLIANPTNNTTVANLVNENGYDLYTFNGAAELEWINMKSSPVVANDGIGYLYANSSNVTLGFAGEIIPAGSTDINLNYANKEFGGFNLIGNPFACNAYVGKSFYVIEGTELVLSENNYVAPCEGFFVEATEAGQSVTISTTAPEAPASLLSLSVSQNRGKAIDRAIVNFDGRNNLHKFMMNPNHTNISLAKNGEEFAAISTAAEGEMPVNFKAEKNGTYTITVSTENVEANYLHLIDNLTGADIDLLTTDSYTFDATTRDYASRFKLVFGVNNSNAEVNGNSFAYISNGELIISNEGRATLQVIDMTGRIVSSQEIEGEGHISTEGMTAGVYVLNLNGTTQKIVVR